MKIEVWSDFACPFCYIGKQRLETALEQFAHQDDVKVEFKSFELDPRAPKTVEHDVHHMLAAKYGMTREKAIAMNKNLSDQAAEAGLTFNFDSMKLTNTFDAHRLTHYAAKEGKREDVIKELFQAYFTDSLLLGDHDTLAELAEKAGLDRNETLRMLAGSDYSADVRADEDEAQQLGVTGVPFFVIDRKYAVSGAQSSEVFLKTLETIWQETQPLRVIGNNGDTTDSGVCQDGTCSLN
jgi:predicted DsbA family dithiol-disulfide isomerase